jgi:hypothetical protein
MTTITDPKLLNEWTLIDWDGNTELGYKCYRKSFGKGHVSVGIGEFTTIVYSYGANSNSSMSSTRWRETGNISEQKAMEIVDRNYGKYNYKDNN